MFLFVDGRRVRMKYLRAKLDYEFLGPYKSPCSILPFKFQKLQLVGMFFIYLSGVREPSS